MMLFREGEVIEQCTEDWAYVGNCPLPTCNPGGCDDSAPLRTYIYCRLNLVAANFAQTWRGGDILFVGDSNTDIATAYNMAPILPRAFNAAVLGSRICDVTASVGVIQTWIHTLSASSPGLSCSPSALVLMVGTNDLLRSVDGVDNHFTPATAAMYQQLFARVDAFRSANGQCRIVVRSVLPGIPAASGCCTDGYQPDTIAYKHAVLDANAFLAQLCTQHGFVFLNDYYRYWDVPADTIKVNLYRNGTFFNPCTQQNFSDEIHLGCPGQRVALTDVAREVYAQAPRRTGMITSLNMPPFGPPLKSTVSLDAGMMYRYVRRTVSPGKQLVLTSKNSSYNYAAVFQPGQIGGFPVGETLQTNGAPAPVNFTNHTGKQATMVVCVGTDPTNPGRFSFGQ